MPEQVQLLSTRTLRFAYNGTTVLDDVNLSLRQGDLVALLGPNGSGKTTLLKLLCGILLPRAGMVQWQGTDMAALRRREMARRIAFVPQELTVPFAFTVSEIVSLGRIPYARPLLGETARDRIAVERAIDLTGTRELASRYFGELSGGERQRVVIAMALAQVASVTDELGEGRPAVLLLDEPTVHLDINHQIEILELIHSLNRTNGLTVLATMHDLNLASLYFDQIVLINAGRLIIEGTPDEVLSKERIESVYLTDVVVEGHPTCRNSPQVILLPTNGNGKERAKAG